MHGEFVWDDDLLITKNALITEPSGLGSIWFSSRPIDYWPVTNTTYWVEWRLFGTNTTGYHAVSLLMHLTCCFLIWRVLRQLGIPGSFLAALFFAVHPVNVESVAWISQQKTLLALLFFLLSVHFYFNDGPVAPQPPAGAGLGPSYWASLMTFGLGMLSKGSIATLPLVLLLITWWKRGAITRRDLARAAPFCVIAVTLVLVNLWFPTHSSGELIRSAGLIERLLGAAAAVWFYLLKAVLPIDLMFVYPRWDIDPRSIAWWLPLVGAVALTAVLWWQRTTPWGQSALLALAFFVVTLAPALGFVDVTFMKYSLVADHYQNIALIAVVALVAAGGSVWFSSTQTVGRTLAAASALLLAAVGAGLTGKQCQIYSNPETLFRATIEQNPRGWFGHANLAKLLLKTGRAEEAIEHFRHALELAPDEPENYVNLGAAVSAIGQPQAAIPLLERALTMAPDLFEAEIDLAIALERAGRFDEAMTHAQQVQRLEPHEPEPYSIQGSVLLDLGRPQEAISPLEQAVRLKPTFVEAWTNLAVACATTGQKSQAIDAATKGLAAARAAGQSELVERIEHWLAAYRSGQFDGTARPPASPSPSPAPALPPSP